MTIAPHGRRYPAFTIGDRLRKARTLLGPDMDAHAFADLIGVSRNTVTNYELERTAPNRMKPVVLAAWAMATGVDLNWLKNGDTPGSDGGPGGERSDGAAHQNRTGAYSLLAGESFGWGLGRPLRSIYGPPAAVGKAA